MDVTVDGTVFSAALARVSRAVRVNSPLPILEAVLLRGRGNTLSLIGTDDEHQITEYVTAEVAREGEIAVPAKRLLEIVNGLKWQPIHLSVEDNFQAVLKSGRSRYRLAGVNPIHFPEFPAVAGKPVMIEAQLLHDMVSKCLHAVGEDANRPGTCGGRLILSDRELVLAATDARRLLVYRAAFDTEGSDAEVLAVTLPPATMKALLQFSETEFITMTGDGRTICFDSASSSIASRIIAGAFPDYQKLLAMPPDLWLGLDREILLGALKRLQSISREDLGRVLWTVADDSLTLQAAGRDSGEGLEVIEGVGAGEAITVLPNEQILELLTRLEGPEIVCGISSVHSQRPVWFYSTINHQCLGIVMPLSRGS